MPFVPVPNTLLVEPQFEWDGQRCENTYYFERATGWIGEDVMNFLSEITALIESDLMPLLSSTLKLVRTVGTLLDAVDALSLTYTPPAPISGSDINQPMPNSVSYTVSFLTAKRGRSNRGRNFALGLTTSDASANTINAATRTGLLAYYSLLRTMAASEYSATMVVVSKYSGYLPNGKPAPRAVGLTEPITSFTTFDPTLDSQRRRLPGRGK